MNLADARNYIYRTTDTYGCMDGMVDLMGEMEWEEWLTLLGEVWSGCDAIGLSRRHLEFWLPRGANPADDDQGGAGSPRCTSRSGDDLLGMRARE